MWRFERSMLVPHDDLQRMLKTLDSSYAATRIFPESVVMGYRERMGLYQGAAVKPVVNAAYDRELQMHLLPRVALLMEEQIRSHLKDRKHLHTSLRAYLMLGMEGRRDTDWLKEWGSAQWAERYPGSATLQGRLGGHFERLLKLSFSHPLDERLVARARHVLRRESHANVAYRMLREQARHLPDYRLDQQVRAGDSFVGLDYKIPGLFTQEGYQRYFSPQGSRLLSDALKDSWVMGEALEFSPMDKRSLLINMEQLYFRDYANYWSEAVGRIGVSAMRDFADSANQLANMTSADSPLSQLLVEIRKNTQFPDVVEGESLTAEEGSALKTRSTNCKYRWPASRERLFPSRLHSKLRKSA